MGNINSNGMEEEKTKNSSGYIMQELYNFEKNKVEFYLDHFHCRIINESKEGFCVVVTCYFSRSGKIQRMSELMKVYSSDFENINYTIGTFISLYNMVLTLTVSIKLPNYMMSSRGLLNDEYFNKIYEDRNNIISSYVNSKDQRLRYNMCLATDSEILNNLDEGTTGSNIKKLKACIGKQKPKPNEICYFNAKLTYMEMLMYECKKRFFIPSFLFTTRDVNDCTNNAYGLSYRPNVVFGINTNGFNKFTTNLKEGQSGYGKTANESLISCYNLYEHVHTVYREKVKMYYIELNIIDPDNNNYNFDENILLNHIPRFIPYEDLERMDPTPFDRNCDPEIFHRGYLTIKEKYIK